MNIKTYFDVLKQGKWLILVTTIIVALAATLFSMFAPPRYESATTLTVSRVNRAETGDFQYDNYYAIQSTEFVSNTVAGMLASQDIVREIYDVSGVEAGDPLSSKVRSISARQKTSHLVSVSVKRSSQDEANAVLSAIETVLVEKVEALETTENDVNAFTISAGEAVETPLVYSPVIVFVSSLLSGLFLGIGLVFVRHYLSQD